MEILSCNNLSMAYRDFLAVKDITFALSEGDYLAIIGENGSGKSSLMKGLLGIGEVWRGEVKYNGIKKGDIGYLPQMTTISRDFPATVEEVVISGALGNMGINPFYTNRERKWAKDAMEQLHIEDMRKKSFRELSGGQRQRTLLARAICGPKKLLMLDEPMAGLDSIITEDFYKIVKQLNSEGMTIIHISHDLMRVVQDANKILEMNLETVFFGDTKMWIESRRALREEENRELAEYL
ncbi:MAG: ATP-binding cassette domain-containing protein [Tissierellia bacterium]|nr:ATP-binding cassette domain-containing protein [Tissierellia bacterium]